MTVRCRAWVKQTGIPVPWRKTREAEVRVPVEVPEAPYSTTSHGAAELATALGAAVGVDGLSGEVRVEVETRDGRQELVVAVVNTSPRRHPELTDTNLYEVVVIRSRGSRPIPSNWRRSPTPSGSTATYPRTA